MRDMEAASRALTQAEPQITAAEDTEADHTEADHVEAVADAPPEQGKAMHFVKLMFGGKQRRA